jgi:WD40 repeat protein
MRVIRIIARIILYGFLGLILLAFFLPNFWPAMSGGVRGKYMRQQKHYAEAFKAGDTNVPLFAMDWFAPTVHFCRVNQAGKGSARRDVGHAIQSGVSISLDETNLQALIETINQLPLPPKHSLPVERQIVVGCIRSNQWFRAVYDRANIPKELERVSEITGAYLPWYIPAVMGRAVADGNGSEFFCVANEAPIAISAGYNFLQAWQLDSSFGMASSPLKLISGKPSLFEYEHPIAVSPDGNIIAVATDNDLCAVDWKNGKVLWKAEALEHEGYYGKHLVIGDNGKTLFTAGAHTVERWNLFTGQKLGVLAVRESNLDNLVRRLKISRNGKVLVAGFGNYNLRPNSFAIWDVGKDEPALKFEEKDGADVDISPDGEWIALSRFGTEKLVLFKWRTGERKEVTLRTSNGFYSVLWSPDEKRLAAYVDTYPASIVIYDTASWKPIAHWDCGKIGFGSEFSFGSDGTLYQIRNNEINALDVSSLKSINGD